MITQINPPYFSGGSVSIKENCLFFISNIKNKVINLASQLFKLISDTFNFCFSSRKDLSAGERGERRPNNFDSILDLELKVEEPELPHPCSKCKVSFMNEEGFEPSATNQSIFDEIFKDTPYKYDELPEVTLLNRFELSPSVNFNSRALKLFGSSSENPRAVCKGQTTDDKVSFIAFKINLVKESDSPDNGCLSQKNLIENKDSFIAIAKMEDNQGWYQIHQMGKTPIILRPKARMQLADAEDKVLEYAENEIKKLNNLLKGEAVEDCHQNEWQLDRRSKVKGAHTPIFDPTFGQEISLLDDE